MAARRLVNFAGKASRELAPFDETGKLGGGCENRWSERGAGPQEGSEAGLLPRRYFVLEATQPVAGHKGRQPEAIARKQAGDA